ncbi:Nucleoporin GLE1 [Escovopsis weberi]|uniref:mRNA export factor GLE1 n=1 Tax=Escovopsis weberi TaxID=150374 RepID=A0A0M9VTR1_ESCWE|nr:Nucleoporin GLE1 [Escovopsis weberi]
MAQPSPSGRAPLLSTPEKKLLSNFLVDGRNNELSHQNALAAAQAQHERVRQAAIRVYELHELQEETQRIMDLEQKEKERIWAQEALVAEERRLRELRAKTVPPLSPEPAPVRPKRVEPAPVAAPAAAPAAQRTMPSVAEVKKQPEAPRPAPAPTGGLFSTQTRPGLVNGFGTTAPQKPSPLAANSATQAAHQLTPSPAARPAQPQPQSQSKPQTISPTRKALVDRYSEIHQELKQLRRALQAEAKEAGSPLKAKMGTYRREIRVSIGQLTGGKGANATPINKISAALKEALDGQVPSRPIDVSRYVVGPRQPVDGAPNNDATLPSLFIYLMNICAKGIISQFINECGANPKAADPIGVFAAHIFSHRDFQWRGQPLIDILMAKFRVVCPVLFGLRGSDRTERGRLSLGWRRDGSSWVTEQAHNDRMTGLGAGFASISLRDFSKTSKQNPYPPTNYWTALAGILNCPAAETSNTQFVVLRAMIEGHEQRFLNFYGNAAIAALRTALVEFPTRAPANATAAQSLQAMAEILRAEGLVLT